MFNRVFDRHIDTNHLGSVSIGLREPAAPSWDGYAMQYPTRSLILLVSRGHPPSTQPKGLQCLLAVPLVTKLLAANTLTTRDRQPTSSMPRCRIEKPPNPEAMLMLHDGRPFSGVCPAPSAASQYWTPSRRCHAPEIRHCAARDGFTATPSAAQHYSAPGLVPSMALQSSKPTLLDPLSDLVQKIGKRVLPAPSECRDPPEFIPRRSTALVSATHFGG
ncbi:hypothetical protein CSOJ01_05745 [Colletotrichum sojae]|uniref:Uncharacterized protein n=1 Tax=Colletotrichum sojae TaxID=2175907 RepID=A0A8H6JEG7_9PEZI|nr:hypothetical protein CSOJ01_05745 [Colletotrichum sojae]